jgi:hypothetical protein
MSEKADIYHSEKAGIEHVDYSDEKNLAITGSEQELGHFIADAQAAADLQKTQSTREALAMWRPAIIWSVIFSSAIIMEGYDTILLVSATLCEFDTCSRLISSSTRVNSGLSLPLPKSTERSTLNREPTKSLLDGKPVCPALSRSETFLACRLPVPFRNDSGTDLLCSSP